MEESGREERIGGGGGNLSGRKERKMGIGRRRLLGGKRSGEVGIGRIGG